MTGDAYIQSVLQHLPPGLPLHDHITSDLRTHIAERVEHGHRLEDVLRQLGDPRALAESYLAALPLHSARLLPRVTAKLIDIALVAAVALSGVAMLWAVMPAEWVYFLPVGGILAGIFGFVIYTVIAEYRHGRTIGKRLMGIQVVRESGGRISFGQSVVRQLPFFAQFFWIDALFALFTERRQRAFELLTKTRAVELSPEVRQAAPVNTDRMAVKPS